MSEIKKSSRRIPLWIRRLFCKHTWQLQESRVWQVNRVNGQSEGTVRLTLFVCAHCPADKLVTSDRVHYDKQQEASCPNH